ncbi:Uricase [Tetrabaena socialis]|uniref:Uricase n=1 Tax=Tetrabaena socialis TaxID=47790 RepID=A0A2J7ZVK5_9CHLO|nr:Uricase [Tetrabaena socialis]|eukprot:PNH04289.1 Uricase [Tetrabaena socialis]
MQRQEQLRGRREGLLRRVEQERRAPRADWRQQSFPWSGRLAGLLGDVFGLRRFRPLQLEVMNATLQGRDVLVLLPSGGGKSLCYQLPALAGPGQGLTLVVSPLLSLIQDQVGGVKELTLLKTTQSGYEGFLRDQYTLLPESTDRIMASTVTCTWRYATQPPCYDAAFAAAKAGLLDAFFGPPKGGIYSPSVQFTLYDMAKRLLERVPQSESVFLNMPNIHFLPCAPVGSTFKNDVFVATSEPHGNIEAVVTRSGVQTHSKL